MYIMKREECDNVNGLKFFCLMLKLIEWNEEILLQLILQERGTLTGTEARSLHTWSERKCQLPTLIE